MARRLLRIAVCSPIAIVVHFAFEMLAGLRKRPPDSLGDFPALYISEWK